MKMLRFCFLFSSFTLTQNSFVITCIGKLKSQMKNFPKALYLISFWAVVRRESTKAQTVQQTIASIRGSTKHFALKIHWVIFIRHGICGNDSWALFMMIVFYLVSKFTHWSIMSWVKNHHIETSELRPFFTVSEEKSCSQANFRSDFIWSPSTEEAQLINNRFSAPSLHSIAVHHFFGLLLFCVCFWLLQNGASSRIASVCACVCVPN